MKDGMVSVFGAGSWGTALAILLGRNGHRVCLWSFEKETLATIQSTGCNQPYIPNIPLPETVQVTGALAEAAAFSSDWVMAVPSFGFRGLVDELQGFYQPTVRWLLATKGLDPKSNALLSTVVQSILGSQVALAVLSGPSFALEVANGKPTAVTLASEDPLLTQDMVDLFLSKYFRIYTSKDLVGVQLGGVVKNVMAIATGIGDGLGFGANTRAALITRGLAEMVRMGVALQALPETFMGLAGVGDLLLTCTDDQSRNRRFGLCLGRGESIEAAKRQVGQVIEGADNARQLFQLARQWMVKTPIIDQVYRVIYDGLSPYRAVEELLSRTTVAE